MIKRLDHVNIVVSDLEKAKDFFALLGFADEPVAKLSGKWISEVVGLEDIEAEYIALVHSGSSVKVELIHYLNPQSHATTEVNLANMIGIRHLAFAVDEIETVVDKLQAEGVKFLSDIKTYPATGKKIVYFKGPDNIILELAQYAEY